MDRNDIGTRTAIAQRFSGPVVRLRPALFHFVNALRLPDVVPGDSHGRQLYNLFHRLLAVAEERDKYVHRAAALAARFLLNGRGEIADLYLSERLRERVKTDERNFADEVAALESHQRTQRHIVVGADNGGNFIPASADSVVDKP
jgi:hypothetical protein